MNKGVSGIQWPLPNPDLVHLARKNLIYPVETHLAGTRLDKYVAQMSGLSRGMVRELVDFGAVWVGGKVCRKQGVVLAEGDYVTLQVPAYGPVRFYEADPARILFRDRWLLAYDKEVGIPCQQTPYDGYNNLFAALERMISGYWALHHRLDAPTSGVMVFSRRREANRGLSRLFGGGDLRKIYLAMVQGCPAEDDWIVDRPIAKRKGSYFCPEDGRGKPARTEFRVIRRGNGRSLVRARPLTGRTHQIRLHLLASGYPIIGDTAYGGPAGDRMMLHAHSLSFEHPMTHKPVVIEAPVPDDFEKPFAPFPRT